MARIVSALQIKRRQKKMAKLHELLAVESDLRKAAYETLLSTRKNLSNKQIQVGQVRRYSPAKEGGETFPDDRTELNTTVDEQLSILKNAYAPYMDTTLQKEISNMSTSADVEVDGVVIFKDVPAPALLNMEARLVELRAVFDEIQTLDPAEQWTYDQGQGCYVSSPRETMKTKKVFRNHVLYEATKEHPAQVQAYTEDERIGTWTTIIQSGMITVTDRRGMLERIDKLIYAVKKARQRANDVAASTATFADKIFDYITTY